MWNDAVVPNEEVESANREDIVSVPDTRDHLSTVLSLLHLYHDICPKLLIMEMDSDAELKPLILFTGLDEVKDVAEEEIGAMKVNALHFLSALDSYAFKPTEVICSCIFIIAKSVLYLYIIDITSNINVCYKKMGFLNMLTINF